MTRDTQLHVMASYALALTLLVLGTPWGGAVFVAAAAGVVWEIWRGWRRQDSPRDLVADAVGLIAAVLVWMAWGRS